MSERQKSQGRDDKPTSTGPSSARAPVVHEGQWRGAHPRGEKSESFPSRGFAFEEKQGRPLELEEREAGAVNVRTIGSDEAPLRPYRDEGAEGHPRAGDARGENRAYGAPVEDGTHVARETLIRDHQGTNAPSNRGAAPRSEKRRRSSDASTTDDERIRDDVRQRLDALSGVDASAVEIEVRSGDVHLSGFVADRWQKHRIEDETDRVAGVVEIENLIRLHRNGKTRGVERAAIATPPEATDDGANAAPTREPTVTAAGAPPADDEPSTTAHASDRAPAGAEGVSEVEGREKP